MCQIFFNDLNVINTVNLNDLMKEYDKHVATDIKSIN